MLSPRLSIVPQGPEFSQIVLGLWRLSSWQMSAQERVSFLEQALELGITTIDEADIYGDYTSEALLGEAFALAPHLRQQFQIVSKCGIQFPSAQKPLQTSHIYETSAAHIIGSAENSLRNMQLDSLDLLLIHRPDPLMDADEIAEAFTHLRSRGKVQHFGVSNFTPSQFSLLHSRFPLVTNQVECSLLQMAPIYDGSFDQCQQLRISPMIWSALGGGALFEGKTEQSRRVLLALEKIAVELEVSTSTIALAWIFRHPVHPLVLTGSSRVQALQEAVQASHLQLSREHWFDLWRASTGVDIP
ncbi:aldo/keto reductase [Undibacterium sp. LX40W]|uniref:Aldo/keto reductase n=1 Tax=Undibacterium nitidum TaxID=2762298 RepID=A0A923HL49_9BURK|nr:MULTISPECIES: aldo/keto reductase [Undibacterium]MBC3881665.1 aldo/keto reductase [Undibacterium nitidum]MBC3891552.1 aldo/keto reductase [Undibacterium sp. LX40W]